MKLGHLLDDRLLTHYVAYDASADPKPTVLIKFFEALLEVVWPNNQICVKLDKKLAVTAMQGTQSCVEGVYNATGGFPKPSVQSVHNSYPWIPHCIVIYDLPGIIRRPVINNHPFSRPYGLLDHALDG
jgi:hypothetical protein